MATCEKYGKLYAYLLEVCRNFIEQNLYEEMGLPKDGYEMYLYLIRHLSHGDKRLYEDEIENSKYLSDKEKDCLLPKNRIIKVQNLDISIHFKIIRLLDKEVPEKLSRHVIELRNWLCHLSLEELRETMNQEDFNSKLELIKQNLHDAGIDNELLIWCKDKILKQI